MDYAALKHEIDTDPKSLGYSAFVAAGNDCGIADALNAATGAGAETVTAISLTRDEFLTVAVIPAGVALASATALLQNKWDRLIGLACAADSVHMANVAGLIQMAVGDGLLQAPYAASIGKRTGSRAEVLFGVGSRVTANDVSIALRGGN